MPGSWKFHCMKKRSEAFRRCRRNARIWVRTSLVGEPWKLCTNTASSRVWSASSLFASKTDSRRRARLMLSWWIGHASGGNDMKTFENKSDWLGYKKDRATRDVVWRVGRSSWSWLRMAYIISGGIVIDRAMVTTFVVSFILTSTRLGWHQDHVHVNTDCRTWDPNLEFIELMRLRVILRRLRVLRYITSTYKVSRLYDLSCFHFNSYKSKSPSGQNLMKYSGLQSGKKHTHLATPALAKPTKFLAEARFPLRSGYEFAQLAVQYCWKAKFLFGICTDLDLALD